MTTKPPLSKSERVAIALIIVVPIVLATITALATEARADTLGSMTFTQRPVEADPFKVRVRTTWVERDGTEPSIKFRRITAGYNAGRRLNCNRFDGITAWLRLSDGRVRRLHVPCQADGTAVASRRARLVVAASGCHTSPRTTTPTCVAVTRARLVYRVAGIGGVSRWRTITSS